MGSVSVIIPSRKERYLNQTIREISQKLKGDFEIIVILDGADEERLPGVKYIHNPNSVGMRGSINQAVAVARGKYLMKLDAHCMLDEAVDLKLAADHQPNWIQIPRRKRLNAKKWEIDKNKPDVDYMYNNSDFMGIANRHKNFDPVLKKKLIDDTESFQGSCYFIEKAYFIRLGLLDDQNFDGSGHESQEIAIKIISDGGRIIRNKKTWYAHARLGRLYTVEKEKSREYIHILAKKYGYKKA